MYVNSSIPLSIPALRYTILCFPSNCVFDFLKHLELLGVFRVLSKLSGINISKVKNSDEC